MFSEAYRRSLAKRVALNRQIMENPYWYLPVDDRGFENYMPVGRSLEKTSEVCGVHRGFYKCNDYEAHKGVVIDGVDFTDRFTINHYHWFCHKSSCPVCFIRGWAVRGARFIEGRLLEGVKRGFGEVEHIVVSPPKKEYENVLCFDEEACREKCRLALRDRGVTGESMIFHGFRIDWVRKRLVFSVHYHVLGFVKDFDVCRNCDHKRKDCETCSGFKGREVRGFAKDGYLVKVMDKRETIFGTAFYQLNHSTIRVGVKRFHVVTWGGCCAYNNFKGDRVKVEAKPKCFVCGNEEMVRCIYVGTRHIPKNLGHANYVPWFHGHRSEDADFVEVVSRG